MINYKSLAYVGQYRKHQPLWAFKSARVLGTRRLVFRGRKTNEEYNRY
jgi:hypothetical protein